MSFIGIDLGTSFIKGAVLDPETQTIDHIRRVPFPDPLSGLPPLHREFDPFAVLDATRSLLTDLLDAADGSALDKSEACEGILMCSQMHGLVFATERGEPRSNMVNWQDQRVLEPHPSGQGTYLDVLARQITPDELRQLGNELHPGQPTGVLFWLVEQGQQPAANLVLASLPDFVLSNLCGTISTIEATNAAAHGASIAKRWIGITESLASSVLEVCSGRHCGSKVKWWAYSRLVGGLSLAIRQWETISVR